MKHSARKRLLIAAALLSAACSSAQAQPVVKVVVGGAPGGLFDIVLRIISERVGRQLGSTVVIDHKPGAGNTVALNYVRNAQPDGRTVAMINVSAAANESIIRNRGYDLLADFEAVGLYAYPANILIINPSLPANNVVEFVRLLKGRDSATNYSSGGVGSPGHLAGEMFRTRTGTRLVHVPYKGAPPAVLAVVTGEVDFMFATASSVVGQIKGGQVRALAVTTIERLPQLPDLPTMSQAGLGDFDVSDWVGFLLPKGVPPAVRDGLHAALLGAFTDPEIRERLSNATFVPAPKPLGPAEFGAFLRAEVRKWAKVAEDAKITER